MARGPSFDEKSPAAVQVPLGPTYVSPFSPPCFSVWVSNILGWACRQKRIEREEQLRSDPHVDVLGPEEVKCLLCGSTIKLSKKSAYDSYHWVTHKKRCIERMKRSGQLKRSAGEPVDVPATAHNAASAAAKPPPPKKIKTTQTQVKENVDVGVVKVCIFS
jgi:hypothetical protein